MATENPSDRRRAQRFDTTLGIEIRFQPDGSPLPGSAIEIGPNGMRIHTQTPLVEASYVHISFQSASNNTHCEGRVVWTQRNLEGDRFESGIDIQRWGGGMPGSDAVHKLPSISPKKDRRKKPR